MGLVISFLKGLTERIAKENKSNLYIGGLIITLLVVSLSGMCGWMIETVSYTHLTLPTKRIV